MDDILWEQRVTCEELANDLSEKACTHQRGEREMLQLVNTDMPLFGASVTLAAGWP